MKDDLSSTDFVQSLARGLDVLEGVGRGSDMGTVMAVAEATGLNRATVRRLLLTLEQQGYVRRSGRRYVLAPRVLELGYRFLSSMGISELVSEELADVVRQIDEAVSMTVRDGQHIVYVARGRPNRVMTVALTVGARLPVWNTSMGRILLAEEHDDDIKRLFKDAGQLTKRTPCTKTSFEEIVAELALVREQGWCLVDQELELGLRSVAIPVRRSGKTIAAVNAATAHVGETCEETRDRLVPVLKDVGQRLEKLFLQMPADTLISTP